jgi:hypothetical protein
MAAMAVIGVGIIASDFGSLITFDISLLKKVAMVAISVAISVVILAVTFDHNIFNEHSDTFHVSI